MLLPPKWAALSRRLEGIRLRLMTPEKRFKDIYANNKWESGESISGPGSNLSETAEVRDALPKLLDSLKCRSLLDIPCGDLNWIKTVDFEFERYIGADIVDELVVSNRERYPEVWRTFQKLDLTKDTLPKVDVVLCRDCLVHLSLRNIQKALFQIVASGSQYLIATNHQDTVENIDILTGYWRPLNLTNPPFNLPQPFESIVERSTENPDKVLAVWKVADIAERLGRD